MWTSIEYILVHNYVNKYIAIYSIGLHIIVGTIM